MPDLLDADAIQARLSDLPEWKHEGGALTRTWELKGFNGAVQLANVIAFVANQAKHHPDITMHDYNRVTVAATTHDAGGVTSNDTDLAHRIDAALASADTPEA